MEERDDSRRLSMCVQVDGGISIATLLLLLSVSAFASSLRLLSLALSTTCLANLHLHSSRAQTFVLSTSSAATASTSLDCKAHLATRPIKPNHHHPTPWWSKKQKGLIPNNPPPRYTGGPASNHALPPRDLHRSPHRHRSPRKTASRTIASRDRTPMVRRRD